MKFSIVIPTMWRSDCIDTMLPIYENSPFVGEIIVIDNDTQRTPTFKNFTKIVYLPQKENIYVNPAWNLGASLAKYEIILANDDIFISELDRLLQIISTSNYDVLGVEVNSQHKRIFIETKTDRPTNSFGSFLYIKNYIIIPEQLTILAGDNIQMLNKKCGIIRGSGVISDMSTTINKLNVRNTICLQNRIEYNTMIKKKSSFNIIIRTSGRPNFFENCIESIRKYAPNAKLHIIIDNKEDLNYVRKTCIGLMYDYYLVNRKTIQNFCNKIPIERKPFIFNYYFNVAMNFIDGFCEYLDDDDELKCAPDYSRDVNTITLYKADVIYKVVPSVENFGVKPVLRDISGLCIIFHSSQYVDWTPQKGGDYLFIKALFDKCKTVWIDKILSKCQVFEGRGEKKDLPDKIQLTRKVKLAICITTWQRPEVTRYVFNYYKKLKEKLKDKIDLVLLTCGSEGKESKQIAENYEFIYIEHPNNPLTQKANQLYLKAKEYNPDACIKIDSDSIVGEKFFIYYANLVEKGVDYAGIEDIYFLVKDRLCYWAGYTKNRKGETTGVGRFLSRGLLEKVNWKPLGEYTLNSGLDGCITKTLAGLTFTKDKTSCKTLNEYCIDIKSNINITPFDAFQYQEIIQTNDFHELDNILLNPEQIKTKPIASGIKKIVIVVPCWGRSDILRIFCRQMDLFCQTDKADISCLYILSEEDAELKKLLNIIKKSKHQSRHIFFSNEKLGAKLNAGFRDALKDNPDYIMNCDSDDLLHPNLINYFLPYMNVGTPVFGLNSVIFFQDKDNIVHSIDYNHPFMVGCGRMFSQDVIRDCFNKYNGIYTPHYNRILNADSETKIKMCGYDAVLIDTSENPMCLDIKTTENINSFKRITKKSCYKNKIDKIEYGECLKLFPVLKLITPTKTH